MVAELSNVASDAASYFSDIRVPATFLAGAAVGGMFTMKITKEQSTNASFLEYWTRLVYFFSSFVTFLLAMNTAIMSSAAFLAMKNTAIYSPLAKSAFELLSRDFYYELAVTRWSYEISMLAFILSVLLRGVLYFDLFDQDSTKKRKTFGSAFGLMGSGLILHLLSYMNTHTYQWNSLWHLTVDVVRLVGAKNIKGHPAAAISTVLSLLGFVQLGRGIVMPRM